MDKGLNAFLAIAEHGNLTAAAEFIGLTQPSLTKRLTNLEHELQCKLFTRHRRGMSLTPAGRSFLRRAQRVEQEMLQANEELRSLENAGLDTLRVGAGPLFHQQYVAPVFSNLLQEFPALRLDLTIHPNEVSLPMLLKGELDLVLGVIQQAGPEGALKAMPMTSLEHGIITSPEALISTQRHVCADQMRDLRWVLYGDDKDTEDWLNDYFWRNNLGTPNISVRTASFASGLGLVRGTGFVMMAPIQLAPVIERAGLTVLPTQPALTNLKSGAYVRPSSMGFPAIRAFLDLLKEEIAQTEN